MSFKFLQADATALPFEDNSVDLIFTSPPYCDARTYGIGAQRDCVSWVDWMLRVVRECCRVSRGLVLINCAGVTRDRVYQPAPEGLCWEWYKQGGNLWTPAYWHRIGIPGSGGKHWLRKDVEYVLCFKRDREWPEFSNNTAMGHPPKWGIGGEMSNRLSSGARVNQWGKNEEGSGRAERKADGVAGYARPSHQIMRVTSGTGPTGEQLPNRETAPPVLANPGNKIAADFTEAEIVAAVREALQTDPTVEISSLVKFIVGGGVMGHPLCHENEAPFPESLAEFFLRSFCPPNGTVLDPFSGSGTTVAVAHRLGMHGIGTDLRESQVQLGRRRLENPNMTRAQAVYRVPPPRRRIVAEGLPCPAAN